MRSCFDSLRSAIAAGLALVAAAAGCEGDVAATADGGPGLEAGTASPDRPPEPSSGCFAPGQVPPSSGPNGLAMPTLEDERRAYRSWGWTWSPSAEPSLASDASYQVADPDIHGDTEGDDLWSYLMMFLRTGQNGYRDRAAAWASYFKLGYRQCVGTSGATFCYDRDAFGADHLWGWGLLAWHQVMADAEALTEAERLGDEVARLWAPDSPFGCLPRGACTTYGVRQVGRHLLFVTRLAEATGSARWAQLRDQIIAVLLASGDWDAARGMYFLGEWSTDQELGAGAYAAGARLQGSFQIGVLSEALDQAYRSTGRQELRDRMVAMARFVDSYGLDPTYQYTASWFGIVGGRVWHSYSATTPVTYWDPVYTTSLVNTLVRGYRYTCDSHFYDRARYFFERGNKGIYGEPTRRAAPDGVVDHFVDTRFASSSSNFYLDYNKGELQYTYLLFAPP